MYYHPYAWASQHSLSEKMYINFYIFLIIRMYSINIGALHGWVRSSLSSHFRGKSSLSSHFQNPHFPCIFKILTFLTFSSSQKLTHVTYDCQISGLLWGLQTIIFYEHFISQICSLIFDKRLKSSIFSSMILDPQIFQILDPRIFKILARKWQSSHLRFPRKKKKKECLNMGLFFYFHMQM